MRRGVLFPQILMKRILLVITGIVIISAVMVAVMQAAQPKITWSSPNVYAGITSTTMKH